jgi:alkylation response protein AidB-like acyl-CoA dehydrogenase
VIDDWSGFGQRTTASGTVVLDDVFVPESHVIESWRAFETPSVHGPVAQIIQAAIDAGSPGAPSRRPSASSARRPAPGPTAASSTRGRSLT